MDKAKEKIPKEFRIGDTCFTLFSTIGGNIFAIHQKNLNHIHRGSNGLLSVIKILGTYFIGGETVFNDVDNINDIGKRAHVLKHSYGSCVVGAFDKSLNEGSIWTGHGAVLLFIVHK